MYQSARQQLINAEKEVSNVSFVKKKVDDMLRNQLLMQGISPIIVEQETPTLTQEKEYIISSLRNITTQPIKFYDYLYNTNQIADFSIGIDEFVKKKLRYKRNIPFNSLKKEWEDYKRGGVEITPLEEIKKYENKVLYELQNRDKHRNEQKKIIDFENKERKDLDKEFETEFLNAKKKIMKEIQKTQDIEQQQRLWNLLGQNEEFKRQMIKQNELIERQNIGKKDITEKEAIKRKHLDFLRNLDFIESQKASDIGNKKRRLMQLEKEIKWVEKRMSINNMQYIQQNISEEEREKEEDKLHQQLKSLVNEKTIIERELQKSGSGIKRTKKQKTMLVIKRPNKVIYPLNHMWNWM